MRPNSWTRLRRHHREPLSAMLHRPRYSIRDVALLSGVRCTTLWSWGRGEEPLLPRAGGDNPWSFANVVEARVLNAIRAGQQRSGLRRVLAFFRERFGDERPLISEKLRTMGPVILFARDGIFAGTVEPTRRAVVQTAFEAAVRTVAYENGLACSMWLDVQCSLIRVDPRFHFGEPFLNETSVPLRTLSKRHRQGESFAELAHDYELSPRKIRDAVTAYDALRQQARREA